MRAAIFLAGSFAVLTGCSDRPNPPPATSSRVNAVKKKPQRAPSPREFCDIYGEGEAARPFAMPALDVAIPARAERWRWVNVWATWCKPCLEEMPMINRWHEQLAKEGAKVELVFLSVDEEAETLAAFRAQNPTAPGGPRMQNASEDDALETWLKTLGLDAAAAIPINVFVEPQGTIGCIRTGALSHYHYDAVRALVSN